MAAKLRLGAISALALACAGMMPATGAETPKPKGCPSSFTPMANYCFSYATADIVMPSAPGRRLTFRDSDCRTGYKILVKSLCFSAATGDIEIANVKSESTAKRTSK